MKKHLFSLLMAFVYIHTHASTVTNVTASYRNGQTFLVWNVIPGYTGYYYAYRYNKPITKKNIDSATYMGRTPYNFTYNYFLNLGFEESNQPPSYLVVNNNPTQQLSANQGLFVVTCASNRKSYYYAITSDSGSIENRRVVSGGNTTATSVAESIAPIQAYLQVSHIPLIDNPDLFYDAYVVFGGNVTTSKTPAMTNEGCLYFNFGIVKDNDNKGPNAATFFFYGGGGNAYGNCNSTSVPGMWKISMEDNIPNFNWDPDGGENTKWIGYNDNFDVYAADKNTPWPTTGINHSYSLSRIKWTYDWLLATFPHDIDPTCIYTQGSSEGTTGALLLGFVYPGTVAATDVTNDKVNLDYLYDDNPKCKWNVDGSSRTKENIFIGDYIHNLPSDIKRINGTGNYDTYEFCNYNTLVNDNQKNSLPIIFMTSGQQDYMTCWEEKVPFYNTVNTTKSGGFYYWDQRQHKGGSREIPDRPLSNLMRYRTNLSYPAFQNCSADSYAGDTINPNSPYYDGDSVGTKYGSLDWIDTSIHETSNSWQAIIYAHQFELQNGAMFPYNLPQQITTDITLRRLQQFINIPNKTTLCLDNYHNGQLIQSKSIQYKSKSLITFKSIKINQGSGDLIKIYKCSAPLSKNYSTDVASHSAVIESIYPNPASDITKVTFSLNRNEHVWFILKNLLGEQLLAIDEGEMTEGRQSVSIDLRNLIPNIYLLELHAGTQILNYKIIKN